MDSYDKMYYILCKAVDSAIDKLEKIPQAAEVSDDLQKALLEAEEVYICEE